MKIYTGNAFGKKLDLLKKYDLGIMISSHPTVMPQKDFKQISCALDNGAFPAYQKGYPFPETTFLKMIDKCYSLGITLDFIVCPDIVGEGQRSLDFSIKWATEKLSSAPNLAFVLQDGMTSSMIDEFIICNTELRFRFNRFFVGGTPNWKWRTLPGWISYGNSYKIPIHVGGAGTVDKLRLCKSLGADSVDSTNISRNNSWSVIQEFHGEELF